MCQRDQETSQSSLSRSPRAARSQCQKKVSTWSYKVLSFSHNTISFSPSGYTLGNFEVGHADHLCASDEEYGGAEFVAGQEEPVEVPNAATTSSLSAPAKTETAAPAVPVIPTTPKVDVEAGEGYSLVQKALFFAVILGCVVAYMKMSNKRTRRFTDKSMA